MSHLPFRQVNIERRYYCKRCPDRVAEGARGLAGYKELKEQIRLFDSEFQGYLAVGHDRDDTAFREVLTWCSERFVEQRGDERVKLYDARASGSELVIRLMRPEHAVEFRMRWC